MSLAFDQWLLATITVKKVRGEPALQSSRLLFDLTFKTPAYERPYYLTEIRGELVVNPGSQPGIVVGRMYPCRSSVVVQLRGVAHEHDVVLAADLSREAAEFIEKHRTSEDLSLQLYIHAVAIGEKGYRQVTDTIDYRIAQSVWVSVLDALGYRRTLLLEIPLPNPEELPLLGGAGKYLLEAQDAILGRRYRDAVAACRDVLESLSASLDDSDDRSEEARALFENVRSLTKEGRYKVVRKALRVLSNHAKHPDKSTDPGGWDREDAIAAISMTAALLRRYVIEDQK